MTRPDLFVALGPEDMRQRDDADGAICRHDLTLSVVTRSDGFLVAKQVAARVAELLDGADLPLTGGRLMGMRLRQARARVDEGEGVRRIDLSFRAHTEEVED
jgi:hypothetical protein